MTTDLVRIAASAALLASISGPQLFAQPLASSVAIPVAQEFERLHFRSIGPATMSGRIADLAVYEANPSIYYVGSAHGGVWKTTSNGALFTPIFQDQGLISVGDVTVSQKDPNLVWVGAGESNNRQSISWGGGVYKSTDGGTTFQLMGLTTSKHINRIVIDPTDNNIVLVAATGSLFGPGGDRGVYKTTDAGRTWKQVLKVDDETGANDLAMSASDPKLLYASMYQRRRTTCCVNGGGPGSGLWRSTDGGDNWTRLAGHGFPEGALGRIAVDIYRKDPKIVYASIEGATVVGRGGAAGEESAPDSATAGGRAGGRGGVGGRGGAAVAANTGTTGLYRSNDGGQTWTKVSAVNPRPLYFSQVHIDPTNPERVYMGGVKMQMTIDGGKTFETSATLVAHDDVHAIWIDPNNPDHLIIGDDGGVSVSYDMSKTWMFIPNLPVGLFYHVAYDMEFPYNVCGGMQDNYDWCGPSASRMGRGIFNYDWFQIQGGDGFVAIPDLKDSRIIYTESQDGNMIRRNKVTGESKSIRPTTTNVVNATAGETYRFHWDTPLLLSPNDPGTLLAAANRLFKSTDRGDSWTALSPDLTKNENRNDIVTMGVKGSDIAFSRNDGVSSWPAIVAAGESPKQAGVYYTGTDDGTVSVSKDGGKTWQNITSHLPGFPSGYAFVSKVVPSRFDAGTVYITVDNHRQNDFASYMWVSRDFGATFRSLNSNLRGENVRTLTEDTRNPDVLYIGTETGIFLTIDRGESWRRLKANFPTVRVDELTIHPRDNALLVATHGRALWILDHLEPIQEYATSVKTEAALFTPSMALQWKAKDDRNDEFWGHQYFTGENPPTDAVIQLHFKSSVTKPTLRITDASGARVRDLAIPATRNVAGIQTVCWDQRVDPVPSIDGAPAAAGGRGGGGGAASRGPIPDVPMPLPPIGYLPENPCAPEGAAPAVGGGRGGAAATNVGPFVVPGTYNVALMIDGKTVDTKSLKIVMDPVVQLSGGARVRYNAVLMDLHTLQKRGTETAGMLNALYAEVTKAAAKLDSTSAPDSVKSQFAAFRKDFDSVRTKFGVPTGGGAGLAAGGGGGRGGAAGDNSNVLARVGTVKSGIMGTWETPSAMVLKQVREVKAALPTAMAEANTFIGKARAMALSLSRYSVTMLVPAPK